MGMKTPRFNSIATVFLVLSSLLYASVAAAVSNYKILHSFGAGSDGNTPFAGVTLDNKGNLYGTASEGGGLSGCSGYGCGIVYQLMPNQDGTWTENVLHTFIQQEGGNSYSTIAIDGHGNLYGTNLYYGQGCGTVFQLVPGAGGKWTENTLHSFTCGNDGFMSYGVTFDKSGHLYGAAYAGGPYDDGVVFSLSPQTAFSWFEIVLHAFAGGSGDGNSPAGNLIFDASGAIFGTTYEGGPRFSGIVFKLSRGGGANWTENVLYSFKGEAFGGGSDGANPVAGVVMDSDGNLYGTTDYGGPAAVGTVFKLAPNGDGTYTESVLYAFKDGQDGGHPYGGVILDSRGNLYGTTQGHSSLGTVYKLTPGAGGQWTETILHEFQGGSDGAIPYGGLVMDSNGNLYGTTAFAGQYGGGVVFEVTP